MAACNVPGFMGDHADHLIGVVRGNQQAGVDKNLLSAGDKGIERGIINQVYAHRRGFQAGDCEQWCPEQTDGILDLRIADKADLSRLGGTGPRQ